MGSGLGAGTRPTPGATGQATQPYFKLTIDLAAGSEELLRHGMTDRVRLRG